MPEPVIHRKNLPTAVETITRTLPSPTISSSSSLPPRFIPSLQTTSNKQASSQIRKFIIIEYITPKTKSTY